MDDYTWIWWWMWNGMSKFHLQHPAIKGRTWCGRKPKLLQGDSIMVRETEPTTEVCQICHDKLKKLARNTDAIGD